MAPRQRVASDAPMGLAPFHFVTNILIWISAVIVMGIEAYWVSKNHNQGRHVIYELVIAVLTVAFFVFSFFLGSFRAFILPFNIIFSYLWLVSVVFTAEDWSQSGYALGETVEAFSFIAFFLLFFNAVYDWHFTYYRGNARNVSAV